MKNFKVPRMSGWILVMLALMAAIFVISPKQLEVVVYKSALVSLSACLSYWIDRSLFSRLTDRLVGGMPRDIFSAARVLARSLIFLGVVLGITLGV